MMKNEQIEVCRSIRRVPGGYIIEIRYPYGSSFPFGEVVCKTFDEVVDLLRKASLEG